MAPQGTVSTVQDFEADKVGIRPLGWSLLFWGGEPRCTFQGTLLHLTLSLPAPSLPSDLRAQASVTLPSLWFLQLL